MNYSFIMTTIQVLLMVRLQVYWYYLFFLRLEWECVSEMHPQVAPCFLKQRIVRGHKKLQLNKQGLFWDNLFYFFQNNLPGNEHHIQMKSTFEQ